MRAHPLESALWAETAQPAPETHPLEGETRAEVAVVGAGYTGLSTALHLARQGVRAVVLEAEEIGYGASGGGIFSLESGKLLGIVEGYRTAKVSIPLPQETYSFDVPMPGETFAAPGAKIRRFLENHGLGALVERLELREREGRPSPVAAN